MDELELLDWRRRVADLYAGVRASPPNRDTWLAWRAGRDELFRTHRQTPVALIDRERFTGADFFEYDPAMRFEVEAQPSPGARREGEVPMTPIGTVEVLGTVLTIFWLAGYAGGLFLPFRDGTSGGSTYGGGRYLVDTAKGADLGSIGDRLVLDFNYAYHPSCAWDARWVCSLAGRENIVTTAVEAGERLPNVTPTH